MWRDDPALVRPMLASTADAPLQSADFVYEPKYDGIRAIVDASARGVRFWSRLGNDKTTQYPEVAAALTSWALKLSEPVVLDGEIVALDEEGNPVGFQHLQRIHQTAARNGSAPTAFIAFDMLRHGSEDLRDLSLRERRRRLETLFVRNGNPRVRISEQVAGDAREMHARAEAGGWEGLIAKQRDSTYKSGRRTTDWRKMKLVRRQACVVAGWTDPRGSRPFFGALILGVYDDNGELVHAGHTGAGFSDAELGRVWKRLRPLETRNSPFAETPKTNEKPHWVKPKLVAELKFTEWTADGKLRHPTYLGLRDDIALSSVRREPDLLARPAGRARPVGRAGRVSGVGRVRGVGKDAGKVVAKTTPRSKSKSSSTHSAHSAHTAHPASSAHSAHPSSPVSSASVQPLLDQLEALELGTGNGTLDLPGGERLAVSNLGKLFWPKLKLTKGDLLRHYVLVAPCILPVVADRPLVMKRFPNGIAGKPFYQHRAPDTLPAGVRVEKVATGTETRVHMVGGTLMTLLYMAQLASISQDPWFSRAGSQEVMDHAAIDLDPPEGLPFSRVLDVARWTRDELASLNVPAFAKTSGAGGVHLYIPLPPDTPYQAGLLFCQIVATIVARKHPKAATVERSLQARGRRIYVDYLQNVRGKTLACAYSARASEFAGVSTPVTWDEIDEGVSPKDFTLRTFAARLDAVGDLWAALREAPAPDLRAVMRYAEP